MLSDGSKTCSCGAGHETFGSCIRAKGLRIGYCGQGGGDATAQKRWDAELDLYRSAVKQGVEPAGSSTAKIRDALDRSEKVGAAFDASTGTYGGRYYSETTKEFI